MQSIAYYTQHPQQLNMETLYWLRQLVAQHPYFHTARLLLLRNLFMMHDPTFDEELHRSAILLPNRSILFYMVEGNNYNPLPSPTLRERSQSANAQGQTNPINIIDEFLSKSTPENNGRKNPAVDPSVDYVAYLMQMEDAIPESTETAEHPTQREQLLEDYIESEQGRLKIDKTEDTPSQEANETTDEADESLDDSFFTETLAKIYVKQGRYDKALEIIRKLSLIYPKKNTYFADQIRFLEKLIINNNKKK